MPMLQCHLRIGRITSYNVCYTKLLRIRNKQGDYAWFYDFTQLIKDQTGQVLTIRGYLFDQSQLKELEFKLAEERQRLFNILWGTNVGTWEWNVNTGEVIFNERWADIIGYQLSELSPRITSYNVCYTKLLRFIIR